MDISIFNYLTKKLLVEQDMFVEIEELMDVKLY